MRRKEKMQPVIQLSFHFKETPKKQINKCKATIADTLAKLKAGDKPMTEREKFFISSLSRWYEQFNCLSERQLFVVSNLSNKYLETSNKVASNM